MAKIITKIKISITKCKTVLVTINLLFYESQKH